MQLHSIREHVSGYATWGCIWEEGQLQPDKEIDRYLICRNKNGQEVKMQSRITAYWPDGSVKWTAHTADTKALGESMAVELRETALQTEGAAREAIKDAGTLRITGNGLEVQLSGNEEYLFDKVVIHGRRVLQGARPVLMLEHPAEIDGNPARVTETSFGKIEKVSIEEQGELLTAIKFEGIHTCGKIPFIIRMIVGQESSEIRFVYTFMYDGDENKDFLKGLGIRFDAPMSGEYYNRHVKVMGDYGVFHEECVPMMSWRPKVPEGIYEKQVAGECLQLTGETKAIADAIIKDAPCWDEYTLCQDSASHFGIRKKLKGEHLCYIDSLHGIHTVGGVAFGCENGSILLAIRDFWEKYPSGVTVKGLSTNTAEATMWLYSPEAPSYDFRHYADRGYNQVCYEGYDYKGADAVGIACTNECAIAFDFDMIPSDERLCTFADNINHPPIYVASPEFYHAQEAFGCWSLPKQDSEVGKWLETQLEQAFEFYKQEVEQRGWYGIFNYGDFMHTYDAARHQWKYDIGGYAWDNTELVPTLWLWLYFLRTGREDVFTLAEKLSRHASEVDVYHFGKYKGLGSRHNVRHWGCPCKEARIAMAAHHRIFYYLTGDRRLEDIFDELKDNEFSFLNKDPLGDFYDKKNMVYPSHARSGPDWSSLCSNWMMEWERKNDIRYRDKICVGLEDIKATPLRLSSGPDFEFDPETVHLRYIGERTTGGCHLQVCMGAPYVWMEIAELLDDEEFRDMIAEHGRFSMLTQEERLKESNGLIGEREYSYPFMFAAMGAYGAKYRKEKWLADKTWRILLETMMQENNYDGFAIHELEHKGNQKVLKEIPWVTTNFVAQWCLNVIMALDLIGEELPRDFAEVAKLLEEADTNAFHRA